MGEGLQTIQKSTKQLIQLTWTDIVITAKPSKGRCKPKNNLTEDRIIIDHANGTVQPG